MCGRFYLGFMPNAETEFEKAFGIVFPELPELPMVGVRPYKDITVNKLTPLLALIKQLPTEQFTRKKDRPPSGMCEFFSLDPLLSTILLIGMFYFNRFSVPDVLIVFPDGAITGKLTNVCHI